MSAINDGVDIAPIHLHGFPWLERKGNECFRRFMPKLGHQAADRRLPDVNTLFFNETTPNDLGVHAILFSGYLFVGRQTLKNERLDYLLQWSSLRRFVLPLSG